MADQILVIEYEPRYTERIREALSSEGVDLALARDGDEALRLVDATTYGLIVLSSVIPRYGTAELVRQIRNRPGKQDIPILLTMSGYSGSNTRSDAARFGATDIIAKPFSAADLKSKVTELLGRGAVPATPPDESEPAPTVRISAKDLLGNPPSQPERPQRKPSVEDELDKMLADTLSGVRLPGVKKKSADSEKPASKAKDAAADIDRLLQDTLSGLEKRRPKAAEPEPEAAEPEPKAAAEPSAVPPAPVAPQPAPPATEVSRPKPPPAPEAPRPKPPPAPEASRPEPPSPPSPKPPEPAPAVSEPPAPLQAEPKPTILVRSPDQEKEIATRDAEQAPAEELEAEDGTRFGQYVLLERIATGGMAEVWKARMRGVEGFEKTVAIKKILPHLSDNQEFVEMFVDEAKLAAQLNHNNIIHIYDLGKISDSYYIAMEYVDGHDLKSILKKATETGNPVPTELALSIASKLAAALDYAHRKRGFEDQDLGIVHRDVSPQNVLISYEGDIKLCDFGIAKAATKASHTQAGALKGKLQYMSPEQAWAKPIDRRSDIFSLSAVLFEMLTGRKLFSGENEISILDQVREAQVSAPSAYNDELTKEIDDVVLRGLSREAADRYQTAGEMARTIDSVLFSYRPTPTAADLAIYMHRLYRVGEEPPMMPDVAAEEALGAAPADDGDIIFTQPTVQAPLEDLVRSEPLPEEPMPSTMMAEMPERAVTVHMEAPDVAAPGTGHAEPVAEPSGKKKSVVPLAAAAIFVVAVAAGAGWYFVAGPGASKKNAAPAAAAPVAVAASRPAPTQAPAPAITPEAADTENQEGLGADDLALIDEAVKKRIEEERKRLEQQERRAAAAPAPQPEANQPEAKAARPEPAKAEAPTPAAAPEPTPAAQEPAPVETKVAPEPAPQPPVQKPAPVARVQEGDLVQPGTPGLVEPELVSLRKLPYPQLARMQRVEGIVFIRALVSETGKVLEAEILRGVSQNVGINEAARDMVLGARFKPATKDGVKVKAYKTIPIPFKL